MWTHASDGDYVTLSGNVPPEVLPLIVIHDLLYDYQPAIFQFVFPAEYLKLEIVFQN